jgi:hypothetical protein
MKIHYVYEEILGEFEIELFNLQLIEPKYKPNHMRVYTNSRSVEQQL